MTLYCQHAPKLRLSRPDHPETVSERPRDKKTELFTDGAAGTQVRIAADVRNFDLDFALQTGAIAELPCPDHPGETEAEPRRSMKEGASG